MVIIGAGPAGLATAACLVAHGVDALVLDQGPGVGASWRGHYERLRLHTPASLSALPGLPLPKAYGRYPTRDQFVAYLERYAEHFGIRPRCGVAVTEVVPAEGGWSLKTLHGPINARHVVVATGWARAPYRPDLPGLDTFEGTVIHSADFVNGAPFAGRRVLVVGLGNSGGEILVDLHDWGALPSVSVREAPAILPSEVLGIPILWLAVLLSWLPVDVADTIARVTLAPFLYDLSRRGIPRPARGPLRQIRDRKRIPLIDLGVGALIADGRVSVRTGIAGFERLGVRFVDGRTDAVDAVVLATGYRPGVGSLLASTGIAFDSDGAPVPAEGRVANGLYVIGFHVAGTGVLHSIARQAPMVAAAVARDLGKGSDRPGDSEPKEVEA